MDGQDHLMSRQRWIAFAAALLVSPPLSEALMFETRTVGQRKVLVVRDCGKQGFKDTGCTEQTSGFSRGDAARLRSEINRSFEEVWLISGGGSLLEGIEVGKVLREYQATVRVPRGYRCVSACTVAFMGGFFRIVDEGASYEVHAASAFLGGFTGDYQSAILKRLNWDAKGEYARFAKDELEMARRWAARLLVHFQEALVPPGTPAANATRLQQWLQSGPPNAYLASGQLPEDAERFRREGVTAAQETLMRLERDAMSQAIEEVRALLPRLGARADRALKMLEAMYSSRIIFTASLSRETLEEMGYVTVFIDPVGQ